MYNCILHLGSNIGFPQYNLELAEVLVWNYIGEIIDKSRIYQTEPWGFTDQSVFLNVAFWIKTDKLPQEILSAIHMIESRMGRVKSEKWYPRIIDIDIIFFEDQIIKNDNLKIPHPQISNRNFVLVPLMDICQDWIDPQSGKTVSQLLKDCNDQGKVLEWQNE